MRLSPSPVGASLAAECFGMARVVLGVFDDRVADLKLQEHQNCDAFTILSALFPNHRLTDTGPVDSFMAATYKE